LEVANNKQLGGRKSMGSIKIKEKKGGTRAD